MHRPYRDLQNLKLSHLYLLPFSHKVVPQVWGVGEGQGGLELDGKSIVNGLEGSIECLFWGWTGCHHPKSN